MGWAAAVFNDFQEEDTDNLELSGIEVPDVIVQTGEEEQAQRRKLRLRETGFFCRVLVFSPLLLAW